MYTRVGKYVHDVATGSVICGNVVVCVCASGTGNACSLACVLRASVVVLCASVCDSVCEYPHVTVYVYYY